MFALNDRQKVNRHTHPTLRRRLSLFVMVGIVMIVLVILNISEGHITVPYAIISIIFGGVVGIFTSRIFHLSWSKDSENVVGKIDRMGLFVLVAYIAFEILRSIAFERYIHIDSPTALTFAFLAGAFIGRVFGIQGKILSILKKEHKN
jgi:ABC-type amino acid transport system permease subunit